MKFIYVVDCITDINKKIGLLNMKFNTDIIFVVKADLVDLFKTYGYTPNAVYYNNLTKVIHNVLAMSEIEDTVICYASLKFDNDMLNNFINHIGNKSKIVNLVPKYNVYEQVCNAAYNVYVNSIFKTKDSLISPKLQFIPYDFMPELLETHLGNRLFELNPEICRNVYLEDSEISKSAKVKTSPLKFSLIGLILTLIITIGLLASIAYYKVSFLIIFTCVILYILNILLTIIFLCKNKFDQRFLK